MAQFKNFRSSGDPIRVESLSGHVAIIGKDFTPIPDVLWSDAYAKGALSEDMKVNDMDSYIQEKKLEKEKEELDEFNSIKEALRKVFDNPVGYVDSHGQVVHRKALALIGKPVKKVVIDKAWAELTSQIEE